MENVNSNRQSIVNKVTEKRKVDTLDSQKKVKLQKKDLRPSNINYEKCPSEHNGASDEYLDNEIEKTEFIEDGEVIQMEINDGGAAATEFTSEMEESDQEDGEINYDTSSQEIDDSQNENKNYASELEQDAGSIEEYFIVPKSKHNSERVNESEKCRSMEDKLDNLNSTLEVMKNYFIRGGLMSKPDA